MCYRNGAIHDVLHRWIKILNNSTEILIFLHFISIINICHILLSDKRYESIMKVSDLF